MSPESVYGTGIRRRHACLLALGILISLACGPLAPKPVEEAPPVVSPTPQPTTEPTQPGPAATPTSQSSGQTSGSDASGAEGMDLLSCPQSGSSMLLKFSANIAVDYDEAHIEHTLQDGLLSLMVSGEGASSRIEGVESLAIPYEMKGSMSDCAFSGQGEMTPSATGYCENGVVYLIIIENWGPFEGKMTCRDKTVPYNMPAMGVMEHTGADGRGKVFYLDKGFSGEGAGYTSIRPFQGMGGSGDHIWTLFYDYTGPVR